ncbi:LPD38 domain-containing protein [Paenibacillus hubeiensis]|uniref:LPD38 domain-containing protein n=1 Tax=Paenibacillus hubeiensis TaxID=3077330 RepID=UPI0031B9BEB7
MATRLEQFTEEQRKKAMEIRDAALNGTLNLQPPSAPVNPRTQAVKQYIASQKSMDELKSSLPPALTQTGPDIFNNSTLMGALGGNRQAIKTYEQATGIEVAPFQGPPTPTQYQINKGKIAASARESPFAAFVAPFSNLMNDLTYGTKAGSFITRAVGTGGGMLLGTPSAAPASTGSAAADRVADITGIAGGFLGAGFNPAGGGNLITAPWRAASGAMATRAGNNLTNLVGSGINKVLPRVNPTTANRVAETALRGAATGAVSNTAMGLVQGHHSNSDVLTNAALGAGLGAAGDLLIAGIGAGLRTALTKLKGNTGVRQAEEILALPLGRGDERLNAAQRRNQTSPGAEPLSLPAGQLSGPTVGRLVRTPNAYKQKFEDLMRVANETRFTPGKEAEELEGLWASMANRNDPSLSELIDLAHASTRREVTPDLLQRARQTQAIREQNGTALPVKSLEDRMPRPSVANDAAVTQERLAFQRPERSGAARDVEVINTGGGSANPRTEAVKKYQAEQSVSSVPAPSSEDFLFSRPGRAAGTPRAAEPSTHPQLTTRVEQEAAQVVESVQQSRVRDRVYNFLDEAEQAARARIAKRRGNINSNPLPEWGDYAIIGAAKMGKGTIKFADWTEEMVQELGEQFRPSAERVYRLAQEELRKQERLATKEGQAAKAFNESGSGDAETFARKVSRDTKKKDTPFAKKWERVRTQFMDDFSALEELEKRVRGFVAGAENSLYKMARLFRGTPERANQIVKDKLAPIINQAEKAGYTADELGNYAVAVHARDVNAANYKSGFTNAEINAVIRKYENTPLEAARQQLVQLNRDMLQELVDSGVVSKDLANVLNDRWKNYIPLFRAFDETPEGFGGRMSESLANVASPIKSLKGSERKVDDPMINMVKNIFQSVNAAERNKVAQQLKRLADLDPEANFIRKLDPDEKVDRKNVVNVKVNGENVKYEVEPEVYRAMLNLDKESSAMIINILAKPASLLRAGATLTPEFSLRNPMRDVLQAYVTSKSGFNPITDFTAGLIQSIKKGPLYKEWIDNLGAYGNVLSMDREVHKKALQAVLREKPGKKFVNVLTGKAFINMLRAITDTTESATKVGEYRAALRQGVSKQEAAYRSRDLMDFARAGSSVRQANKIVAFLNANIQGKSKLIRSIKENPIGTTTRMFVATTLPTLAIIGANRQFANETQKQTIADAPDWMRDTFWLIAIPGTDMVARIPKPFDIAPIFANLPERAAQFVLDKDPKAFDGFLRRTFSDAALPMQITALWPFIEGMANYSFFREGAIIPQREQGLEYKDQYDPVRTTEVAKLLAGIMSKVTGEKGMFKNFSSPRIMDNTIQGLTAGLGTYATSAIDSILKGVGAIDRPAAPEKRIEQRPFLKAFLVDPLQSTKATEKLYTRKDELSKEKSSAKLNGTPFDKERELKELENATKQMSDINKQIRAIEADPNLSAKQKRDQIEPLLAKRNEVSRSALPNN